MQNLIPITNGKTVNSKEDVKAYFEENGISIHGWARKNEFSRNVVKELIYGRSKGSRGQSHFAAIALGMKLPPATTTTDNNQPMTVHPAVEKTNILASSG